MRVSAHEGAQCVGRGLGQLLGDEVACGHGLAGHQARALRLPQR